MADFSSLKQTIQAYIKQNGNEEITGNILQDVLLAMVSTMGDSAINGLVSALQDEITARQNQDGTLQGNITAEATARQQADTALGGRIDGLQTTINGINTKLAEGYIYAGIATPSINPGTPQGKVFYVAKEAGEYQYFLNGSSQALTLNRGISFISYNGSYWVAENLWRIDTELDGSSHNPVENAAIKQGIDKVERQTIKIEQSAQNIDLDFADQLRNVLLRLKDGEIQTKNFNSKETAKIGEGVVSDLDITDDNRYVIVRFKNGHIQTKFFNSKDTALIVNGVRSDLDIADGEQNVLMRLKDGHIQTKYFNSKNINIENKNKVHFSFDDGNVCITDLFSKNYTSVWDSPFFNLLKYLHEVYGAVFTINLFISTFSVITNKFSTELGQAATWLKWSLHGDANQNYGEAGGAYPGGRTQGGQDWQNMVNAVVTLTGNPIAIDRQTRLSNFAGTESNMTAMRDQKFGAICFSASDENPRLSYDFDANEEKFVWENEMYFSSKTRLFFVRSYFRLDDLTINQTVLDNIDSYIESRGFSEFFIHEYSVFNSSGLVTTGVNKLNSFFSFVSQKDYVFDFFQTIKI